MPLRGDGRFDNYQPMKSDSYHETLIDDDRIEGPSNRRFGLTLGSVFTALSLLMAIYWSPWFFVWATLAIIFGGLGLLAPASLTQANRLWMMLAILLHNIINPIIMATLLYVVMTPIGLLLRLFGKDLLRLKKQEDATTYWRPRVDLRSHRESMRRQF